MTLVWSFLAERQLKQIFEFYAENASKKIARNMVKQIIQQSNIRRSNPNIGTVEERLEHRSYAYRYLVYRHYKIYYFLVPECVVIASVFDCRQNPDKIHALL